MSERKRSNSSDSDNEKKTKRRKKTKTEGAPLSDNEKKVKTTKKAKTEVAPLQFDACDVLIEDGIETNADLDYVSMLNIAMSRHKKEFKDLKHEILDKEELIRGLYVQRCIASVWVLDEKTGAKVQKLECTRKARKVRFVKKAAYQGLIQMMLRVNPNLSYEPNSQTKNQKKNIKGQGNGKAANARNVLEVLKQRDIIEKRAAFRTNMVGDQTKGCGMMHVTSCTTFVDGEAITVTAESTKKKTSILAAACMMVDRLLAVCDEEAGELIRKYMGYKSDYEGDSDDKGIGGGAKCEFDDSDASDKDEEGGEGGSGGGNSNSDDDDDGLDIDVDVDGKYSSNRAEFRITSRGIFDTKGDEFKLPKGYKITTAKTNEQCSAFISENIASGTKVGVYVESRDVYRSLHNMNPDLDVGDGVNVVALAVKCGACLISRKFFEEDTWPPNALCELFVETKAELCGYMMNTAERALGFTPDYRHRISDIQTCGSVGIDVKDGIHASLNDIAEHWTSKKLDWSQLGSVATNLENRKAINNDDNNEREENGAKMRMATAVQTAAAVLSAYYSICNVRDAKIRNRLGTCAMKGFTDLMNILTGRKDLFSAVSAA